MKQRDLIKRLKAAGYQKVRDRGDHTIYAKPGCSPIAVPRHREIKEDTASTILKSAGLK